MSYSKCFYFAVCRQYHIYIVVLFMDTILPCMSTAKHERRTCLSFAMHEHDRQTVAVNSYLVVLAILVMYERRLLTLRLEGVEWDGPTYSQRRSGYVPDCHRLLVGWVSHSSSTPCFVCTHRLYPLAWGNSTRTRTRQTQADFCRLRQT